MKIFLLGYMGSGKSTLAKALSIQKKLPFIDLDHYIEQKEGQSVTEIFKKKGEIYFRKQEITYLNELLNSEKSFILALGGGTPCYGTNMQNILKASKNVFYLKYQPQTLAERLEFQKQNRPLIAHLGNEELLDFVRKHLFDRNPYYSQATHIITMDNLSEEQALETILSLISD